MEYIDIKNMVRGLIGTLKGYRPDNDNFDPASFFQSRHRQILLAARSQARSSEYQELSGWIHNQLSTQIPANILSSPVSHKILTGVLVDTPRDFADELEWATIQFIHNRGMLRRFRTDVIELENCIVANDGNGAESILDRIQDKYGYSYWLIELRIAFLQEFRGLESQKSFVESIKKLGGKSILSYVAHQLSVRNEPSTTLRVFSDSLSPRISRLSLLPDTKAFLRHRILPLNNLGIEHRSAILRVANSHSMIDMYETYLDVVQSVIQESDHPSVRALLVSSLSRLADVGDYRISKALLALQNTSFASELEATSNAAYSNLLGSNPRRAYLNCLQGHPADLSQIAAGALALAQQEHLRVSEPALLRSARMRPLAAVFAKAPDFYEIGSHSHKLNRNFWGLPTAKALSYVFQPLEAIQQPFPRMGSIKALALNNRFFGLEDAALAVANGVDILSLSEEQRSVVDMHEKFRSVAQRDTTTDDVSDFLGLVLCRATGDCRKATAHAERLQNSSMSTLATFAKLSSIELYIDRDQLELAISQVVELVLHRPELADAVNMATLFGRLDWDDLLPFCDRINIPIFLDMYWKQSGDEEVATLLRFAFDEFLDRNEMTFPSEIERRMGEYGREYGVYFLKNVCIKSIMDMNLNFASSKDVDDERVRVCSLLLRLDPQNEQSYQSEIFLINHAQMVQQGIQIVDSSRIHVDKDPIANWAMRDLREPYYRYLDLVEAGIGVSGNFDEVLRSLLRRSTHDVGELMVPENEADDLLVAIVDAIRDRFLYDPAHGLDSYLSKRIRHGSLLHHMRSPVEREGLITQRSSLDGKYEENTEWSERLQTLTQEERTQLGKVFSDFSRRFDRIALDLKDQLLHVRSSERPRGMLEVRLSKPAYEVLRAAIQDDDEIEGLVQATFAILWGVLDHSLKKVRDHLRTTVKAEVAGVFDRLRHSLSKLAAADPEFAALSTSIGRASAASQAQVDAVASWFVQPKAQEGGYTYTLEQAVAILVESSVRSLGAFRPLFENRVSNDVSIDGTQLVTLYEVIWVIVQNIHDHCRTAGPPRMIFSGGERPDAQTILIRCENEIGSDVRSEEAEKALRDIRSSIKDGTYRERIRTEGRSGLRKVAGLVHQSDKGRLDFGYIDNTHFYVEVELAFISNGGEGEDQEFPVSEGRDVDAAG